MIALGQELWWFNPSGFGASGWWELFTIEALWGASPLCRLERLGDGWLQIARKDLIPSSTYRLSRPSDRVPVATWDFTYRQEALSCAA